MKRSGNGPRTAARAVRLVVALAIVASLSALGQARAVASQHPARASDASLPTIQWPGMVGLSGWFPELDPAQVTDGTSMQMIYKINSPLLRLLPGAGYSPTSGLASMKVSKNKLVYTFTIRKGAKFSNGDPVTSADVAFSIERHLAHATASPTAPTRLFNILGAPDYYAGKTDKLAGVKIINSRVIQITTVAVISTFPFSFAIYAGQVLDHKVLEGHPSSAANNYLTNTCSANVGAGPFKFVCRNNNSDLSSFYAPGSTPSATLVPNPYYWGPKPKVKLVMQAIKDSSTSYLDYGANQLDVTPLPAANVAGARGKKNFLAFPSTLVNYLSPAVDVAPFDNVHCRLAVAYAIDTAKINDTVLHKTQATIHDMVPKGLVGYYDGKGEPSYNQKKAKAELAKCPSGIHGVKLEYAAGGDADLVYGGAIPAMLSAVGIDVQGQGVSAADDVKYSSQPQKNNGIALKASALGASSANTTCVTRTTGYVLNTTDWSNSTFDALCTKAVHNFVAKTQAAIWKQAQHIALQAGVWITLGQVLNFDIGKSWIGGLAGDTYYSVPIPKGYDWSNLTVAKH
jgi:ABC-type transport system substrate-binding protein